MILKGGTIIYVEFKRVGVKSAIVIEPEQLAIHKHLESLGFKVYLINNPLYFRDIIMFEVLKIFKNNA